MKYRGMILPVLAVAAIVTGCAPKEAPVSSSSPPTVKQSQQPSKVLSDPNVPSAVKQVIEQQQQQHGAPQRPLAH